MSGLVKELLLDYSLGKLSTEQNCDFYLAIVQGLQSKSFTLLDVKLLHAYIIGYTATEIALDFSLVRDDVTERLTRIIKIIEELTHYTDDLFILHLQSTYSPMKLAKLKTFLDEHSQQFYFHTVEGIKPND